MPSPKISAGNTRRRGFTLVEILVVIGLIALLAALGVIIGYDSVIRSTVQSERDLVVMMLTGARTRALANVRESAHGVRVEADRIVLYELVHGAGSPVNERSVNRNAAIVATGDTTIVFDQLTGEVSNGTIPCVSCSVTLTEGAKSAVVEINGQGRIEW